MFVELPSVDDVYLMINCFNCEDEIDWQCLSEVCPEEVGRLWSQQFSTYQQYIILELPVNYC